jgi:hypothetical protein
MWLIGKTVNWANWNPAGRSTGYPVCGEQSSGFAISSVPHLPGFALSICVADRIVADPNASPVFRPRKSAPD